MNNNQKIAVVGGGFNNLEIKDLLRKQHIIDQQNKIDEPKPFVITNTHQIIDEQIGLFADHIGKKKRIRAINKSIQNSLKPTNIISRNSICKCGSNKKYKRCCGNTK